MLLTFAVALLVCSVASFVAVAVVQISPYTLANATTSILSNGLLMLMLADVFGSIFCVMVTAAVAVVAFAVCCG